ncbi:tyrosine-protein phosphatase [Acetohalobium arabaticum]|uniref:protein-tyrosine-phosphatase n=1 Tax=Acetohalobium arabaticum (strain ATCC 49924 / DSM 5501 / Z-7288) TaxID=574087 RepID=D9QTC5_ACEAZ|nr:CpsB/CapC family capsule biosynthesis tyrosine phosphatase [Acetohalobium arabaticum]ADL13625.1 Protein-tyrosine-phosphatase [Acetohalobium arabaticum DSM 5501]
MIDLHSHILPGVDDGVDDIEEALVVAKEAARQGITKMVATPHYLEEGCRLTPEETEEKIAKLQQVIDQAGIDIEILPGAEAYITPDLGWYIQQGKVSTINGSRYLLVEFPMDKKPSQIRNIFYDLKILGYTPVISHPERYSYIQQKPNLLYHWIQDGIYAQLNAGSLLGMFGSQVEETAEILVKHNLVQLIGSDVHSNGRRKVCLKQGRERLEEIVGSKAKQYLENAQLVIKDEEIEVIEPQYYEEKKGFLQLMLSMI